MRRQLPDGIINEVLREHAEEYIKEELSEFVEKNFDLILEEMLENNKQEFVNNLEQRDTGIFFPTIVEHPEPKRRSDNIKHKTPKMEEHR